jgi:molecular chaperone DnaK
LDPAEVETLVHDAEIHAEEDRRRKEEAETRNMADSLIYSSEKLLTDNKDQISQELHDEVTNKVSAVRLALEGTEINGITTAVHELQESVQKVGQAIYSQTSDQGNPGEETPTSDDSVPEDTVEGEFREV